MAPGLTLLVMAGAAVLFALMQKYVKDPREIGRNILKLNNSLYYELTEHLNGIKEIKSYGVEAVQVENFSRVRRLMKKNMVDFNLIQTRTGLFYKVGAAVFISLFLYSAIDIFRLNPQEFIIITVIAARLWPRLSSFQQGLQNINMVLPSFQSVKELEEQCLAAGENLRGVMTIVVIAHRISTIRNADRILVLEQGQIVETGDYQSLLKTGGRFQSLAGLFNDM